MNSLLAVDGARLAGPSIGDVRSPFGRALREFRIRANLSQEMLAERAGLSVECVSTLERGTRRSPQRQTVDLLASGLALSSHDREQLREIAKQARSGRCLTSKFGASPTNAMNWEAARSRFHDEAHVAFGDDEPLAVANRAEPNSAPFVDGRLLGALATQRQILAAASTLTQQIIEMLFRSGPRVDVV